MKSGNILISIRGQVGGSQQFNSFEFRIRTIRHAPLFLPLQVKVYVYSETTSRREIIVSVDRLSNLFRFF